MRPPSLIFMGKGNIININFKEIIDRIGLSPQNKKFWALGKFGKQWINCCYKDHGIKGFF